MAPPVFFTSYARLDNNKYSKLGDAVDELRERVRGLVGANDVSAIGFFDLADIGNGADWVQRLGESVAQCRVLVCFCSNTYFNREICGREFEAFRRRLAGCAPGGRYVFPVIWDKCVLPKALQQFQANSAGMPPEYFEDGLLTLRRVRRDAEYETAIEILAKGIADALNDPPLPHGPHPIDFDQLPSAFDNPGANAVRVAVLADADIQWETMAGRTARAAIERATALSQFRWRHLHNAALAQTLSTSRPDEEPVLLIVPEPSQLWAQRLLAIDRALNRDKRARCAVLFGHKVVAGQLPAGDAVGLQRLPESLRLLEHHAVFDDSSADSLSERARLAIDQLQASVLLAGNVATVRDATLENDARNAGVPLERPVLAGPGQGT